LSGKNKGGERERGIMDSIVIIKGDTMTFEQAVAALQLKKPFTQEPVSPCELTAMLQDDVILALTRPGSWEGAAMLRLLEAHGLMGG